MTGLLIFYIFQYKNAAGSGIPDFHLAHKIIVPILSVVVIGFFILYGNLWPSEFPLVDRSMQVS